MELSKTVLATLLLYASVSAQSAPAPADTPNADYQTEVAQVQQSKSSTAREQ